MIKLYSKAKEYTIRNLPCFPDGSINVNLSELVGIIDVEDNILLQAYIKNSNDLMQLLLTVNAIRNIKQTIKIGLSLPYIPYQQQDRVCRVGEALSIQVFASLINSCNFEVVVLVDPHSDVAPALINNCRIIPAVDVINQYLGKKLKQEKYTLVIPDAGAIKRVQAVADFLELDTIQGMKIRDKQSGYIKDIQLLLEGEGWARIAGNNFLVVDDIALSGNTFLPYAQQLKRAHANKVELYVSHGIFNNGIDHFYSSGYDTLYTTDSICTIEPNNKFCVFQV